MFITLHRVIQNLRSYSLVCFWIKTGKYIQGRRSKTLDASAVAGNMRISLSGCVFILESQKNPIVAVLLYVRPGVKEYISIHQNKKSVINLTFIFSALPCVAVTSRGLSRARLREGLEGNWGTNHYIAKEDGDIILNYKLQSVDFSEKSSTRAQLACSPVQGFALIFSRVLSGPVCESQAGLLLTAVSCSDMARLGLITVLLSTAVFENCLQK